MNGILSAGQIINGTYELIAPVGEGGMGSVYKARQLNVDRIVALKFLNTHYIADKDTRARFFREGKLLSRLAHRHMPAFYEFSLWDGQFPFIAMEFLEGKSLRVVLTEAKRLSWTRCLHICTQVCEAMSAAHEHGIIHRDLKPNNIMLLAQPSPDYVKIVDFGLARLTASDGQTLTETGLLIGSIYYMSPEQCLGRKADLRADVYALGCIMYEALTGRTPFDADTPIGLMHHHVNTFAPAPSTFIDDETMPQAMDFVLERAMAKDPSNRYQSMQEFADDLRLVAAGQGRVTGAATHRRLRATHRRRWNVPVVLCTVGAVAVATLLMLSDEGTAMIASVRATGPRRFDDLLSKGKEIASTGRPGAAIKIFELVADQSPHFVQRATALVELSLLLNNAGKVEESQIAGRRAIMCLALTSKRMSDGIEESDSKLVAQLLDQQLNLLSALGYSINFDTADSDSSAPLVRSLRVLQTYFQRLKNAEALLSMKLFEGGALQQDKSCSANKKIEYNCGLAMCYLDAGFLQEGLVCSKKLEARLKAVNGLSMELSEKLLKLALMLVNQRADASITEQCHARAKQILSALEPAFNSAPAELKLEDRLSMGQAYVALGMLDDAERHVVLGLDGHSPAFVTARAILSTADLYGCAADIELKRGNDTESSAILDKGMAYFSRYRLPTSDRLQLRQCDVTSAVCLARAQLLAQSAQIQLRQNQFSKAELALRESRDMLEELAVNLEDLAGKRQILPETREVLKLDVPIVESRILEVARSMHACLIRNRRTDVAVLFHRECIDFFRQRGRFQASGVLYNLLADAMVIAGRYGDLDRILQECQTPTITGTGLYEPEVRFDILLSAASSYSMFGEYDHVVSGLKEASERVQKLGTAEQKSKYFLLLGEALVHTDRRNSGKEFLARSLAAAEQASLPYKRTVLLAMARLDLLEKDFSAARAKLLAAEKLQPLANEDVVIERACLLAADKQYQSALSILLSTNSLANRCKDGSVVSAIDSVPQQEAVQKFQRLQLAMELSDIFAKSEHRRFLHESAQTVRLIVGDKHPLYLRLTKN